MGTGIGGIRVQDQLFMLDQRGYTPTLGPEPMTTSPLLPRTTATTPRLPTAALPTGTPTPNSENPAARSNHPLGGPPGQMKKMQGKEEKGKQGQEAAATSPTQGFNAALAAQGAKPTGGIAPTAPPPNPLSTAIKTNTDALTSSVSRVFA